MVKRLLVASVALLAFGGCAGVSGLAFPHRYALAAPTAVPPAAGEAALQAVTLRVARVDTPPWLAGTQIYYRLAYQHDGRIAAYSWSQWIAPPATQLERLLEQVLRDGHTWAAVLGPGGGGSADVSVHLRLDDFSQHFATRDDSYGVVDATATLVENDAGHVIAQKHFRISEQAPSADAEGGVQALDRASTTLAMRLRRWVNAHMPSTGSRDPSVP